MWVWHIGHVVSSKWLHQDNHTMAQLGLESDLNLLYCSSGLGYDCSIMWYSFMVFVWEDETILFESLWRVEVLVDQDNVDLHFFTRNCFLTSWSAVLVHLMYFHTEAYGCIGLRSDNASNVATVLRLLGLPYEVLVRDYSQIERPFKVTRTTGRWLSEPKNLHIIRLDFSNKEELPDNDSNFKNRL